MSMQSQCYDDLTTDAIPSPPRDEVKEENESENIPEKEEINSPPPTTKHRTRSKGFNSKPKKGPTEFKVININNANNIQVGSNITIHLNKSEKPQNNGHVVTDAIKKLFNCSSPVDRNDLIIVTPHLNEEWRTTARKLNYTDGHISQFYEDYYRSGIKEVIYQILLDWMQDKAEAATVSQLSKILWETGQFDAVGKWSEKKN